MTATTVSTISSPVAPQSGDGDVRSTARGPQFVADAVTLTWRNLLNLMRRPETLVFSTIQPVIFVLLFRYVFGGSIQIDAPYSYVDFLMPGIFAQTITFGAINTGVGLAEDLNKGLIDRFRSLPMARSSVLIGRTTADLVRNVFVITLMVIMGYAVGFRVQTNAFGLLGGIALMLLFAFALSWIFATIGLATKDAEAAQAASFPILAPLTFASSAFVQVESMPGWLQAFARNQPVTKVIDATRAMMLGHQAILRPTLVAGAWCVGIVAVFAPIAVRKYRSATG